MKIKAALIPVLCVLALAACKSEERLAAERALITSRLPDGCEFVDLGEYNEIDQIVAVVCDRDRVVTTRAVDKKDNGKTTTYEEHSVTTGL